MFDLAEPQVPQISAEEVKAAIEHRQKIVLLDVRTEGECARGVIVGAINLPVDQVIAKVEGVVPDKEVTVYVYCLSGSRSVYAVAAMIGLGYQHVYSMTSGLLSWRAKGYSLGV